MGARINQLFEGGVDCRIGVEFFPCKKLSNSEKNGNLLEQGPGSTVDIADIPIVAHNVVVVCCAVYGLALS